MGVRVRVTSLLAGCIALGVIVMLATIALISSWEAKVQPQQPVQAPSRPLPQLYTFPNGGRRLFPAYRLVALYGAPGYPELGALGQQTQSETIVRAKQVADQYKSYASEHILPTLEIIATIASADPTDNGDYSQELPVSELQSWVTAARQAGVYVVLDLQSGRTDFLTQAKEYEPLLLQPNVGLALDPEWRLGPSQVPLVQIGSVGINEVNATLSWLADLTAKHRLPQKLLVLHQFRTDMIQDRNQLDTSHSQLAYIIQMDGQGSQPEKQSTWQAITSNTPRGVRFGWKNFYQKDSPMLNPVQTMAINPKPWYVSYQ